MEDCIESFYSIEYLDVNFSKRFDFKIKRVECNGVNLHKTLQNFNLALKEKDLVLIEWQGIGKSSFLEILAGLNSNYTGKILIDNKDIKTLKKDEIFQKRAKIGFVFQKQSLISNLTVKNNIQLPLDYHGQAFSNLEIESIVNKILYDFELIDIKDKLPENLTTTQTKLVAFARALILRPTLLFIDEPTIGIDYRAFDIVVKNIKLYANQATKIILTNSIPFKNELIKQHNNYYDIKIIV